MEKGLESEKLLQALQEEELVENLDQEYSDCNGHIWLIVLKSKGNTKWHTMFWVWNAQKEKKIGDVAICNGKFADIYINRISGFVFVREHGKMPVRFDFTGSLK